MVDFFSFVPFEPEAENGSSTQAARLQQKTWEEPARNWDAPSLPTVPSSATTSSQAEAKAEQKYRDLLQKLRNTPDSLNLRPQRQQMGPAGRHSKRISKRTTPIWEDQGSQRVSMISSGTIGI